MTKTELKKNIDKIKGLILGAGSDYDKIDAGIELARGLDEPAVFEALLDGCKMGPGDDALGRYHPTIIINPDVWDIKTYITIDGAEDIVEVYESESYKYVEYAILNMIVLAPKNSNIHSSIMRSNLTSLDISECKYLQNLDFLANLPNLTSLELGYNVFLKSVDVLANLPNLTSLSLCSFVGQNVDVLANLPNLTSLSLHSGDSLQNLDGLVHLPNLTSLDLNWSRSLQNVDVLANLPNLTSLSLNSCDSLQIIDGLANLTNLTSLNLSWSRSLQNVDVLANLPNLTSLDLSYCSSLQNVNGLTNCTNLTSLDLCRCEKVHPKPIDERMSTREEVAAYQAEIRKSIK